MTQSFEEELTECAGQIGEICDKLCPAGEGEVSWKNSELCGHSEL